MKRKIEQAFEHQTPEVLENVLSACKNEKGEPIMKDKEWRYATPRKRKKTPWLGITATAAVLALIVGIGFSVWSGRKPSEQPTEQVQPTASTCEFSEDTTLEPTEPTEPIGTTVTPIEKVWTIEGLVAEYKIAPAKAERIARILNLSSKHTAEELVALDIDELFALGIGIDAQDAPVDSVQARKIAMEDANLDDVWNMESENIEGIYEIRFSFEESSYFYQIDAENGAILDKKVTENPDSEDQLAAIDATLKFFEDFTSVTFLGEERNLTKHLVSADAEIWANALDFLPCVLSRYYYEEFWLTNQREYILEFAAYWRDICKDIDIENLQVEYSISEVNIVGNFAQIYLSENKSFNYVGEAESWSEDTYEIMLTNKDGTWKIFDLASHENYVPKYSDGLPEPPLVIEAYCETYYTASGSIWYRSYPQITIEGEYAAEINEKFEEEIGEKTYDSGITYEWHAHGDLLTLIITRTSSGFEPYDIIYTLRISDGGKATREEILAAAGVTEEDLVAKAHKLIGNTYGTTFSTAEYLQAQIDRMPGDDPNTSAAFMQYAFGRSVSRENIGEAVLYLSKEGVLCFRAKIYQTAGADYHERTYSMTDEPDSSPFYETLMTYSIARAIPISDYVCEEALQKALNNAGTTEGEVTELQCFATYYVTGGSFYKICFTLEDVPHTYYYTVDTCEPVYEMT